MSNRDQIRDRTEALRLKLHDCLLDVGTIRKADPEQMDGDSRRALVNLIARLDQLSGTAYSLLMY